MTMESTIEDLRLPCEYGDFGCYEHGRVPTRQELIDMLSIDLEAVAAVEHDQWMQWSKTIADRITDKDWIDRWGKYWVSYDDLDEDVKEQDRAWARKAIAAALGGGT